MYVISAQKTRTVASVTSAADIVVEHDIVREFRISGATCALCGGGAYPPWLTDDATWCAVMGDSQQQVCLPCFYNRAATGGEPLTVCLGGVTERQGAGLLTRGLGSDPSAGSIPAPSAGGDVALGAIVDVGWIVRVKESLPHKAEIADFIVMGCNAFGRSVKSLGGSA